MNALAEKIAERALTLSEEDRAAVTEVLLRSLKPPVDAEDMDRLWAEEAEKRVREIEEGKVTLLDGQQALQEIRERLRAHLEESVTDALNRVYSEEDSTLDPSLARLQSASLPEDDW